MAKTYTVKKGDTLSEIAEANLSGSGYSSTYAYVDYLVKLNDIKDPNYIVVGQKIALSEGGESSTSGSSTKSTSTTSRATIKLFGLQSNTDRTMYLTWTWSQSNTENYQVIWYYDTGDNVWFIGTDTKVTDNQCLYTAPANALKVKVKVKPISKTKTVNKQTTSYWTATWSTEKTYSFSDNPPSTPSTPSVSIKDFKLTAELNNLDVNATHIEFQIVKNNTTVFNTGKATITNGHASYSCTVAAGFDYTVRCRSIRGSLTSDWTQYSSSIGTIPATPKSIIECRAASATSIYIEWEAVDNATSYAIEYTTKSTYFDGSDQTTTVSNIEFTHYEKTGLTSGEEYFFRVRAVNDKGHSGWSDIKSVIIGKPPAAPTTWSSTTTAITGDPLVLYWVHNAEDGSKETYAEVEMYIDGEKETTTIRNTGSEDDEDQKTGSMNIPTSEYVEGTIIKWRVRTAGITDEYGEWSIQRTITVNAPPTLELNVTDAFGNRLYILDTYPFYVDAYAGPATQNPTGYHLTITSNESYDTVDNVGNMKTVNKGEQVFSKYYDISDDLHVKFSASNLSLENNISYTITCLVSMDSGLTKDIDSDFKVAWTDDAYEPNAEIGIDIDTYTAFIRPFCKDEYGKLIDGVTLSVYRREFDGEFTELGTELDNSKETFITDPHPALDYARYRIVATSVETGKISYYDVPGYPVGGNAVIIQWSEAWNRFDTTEEDALEQQPWTGSMLKLPYNIDVSDSNRPDIALVEYIGRKYPVSYYGTQLGSSSSWNMSVPKSDKETLYALRRLAAWMGDVYVREPSGSGYWANISVSFSQRHLDTVIPVSLNITRVAGGI